MCYRFKEPLHRFQNMIIDRMVGIDHVPAGDDMMTPMFVPSQDHRADKVIPRRPGTPTGKIEFSRVKRTVAGK
jgi:hypothetical protein